MGEARNRPARRVASNTAGGAELLRNDDHRAPRLRVDFLKGRLLICSVLLAGANWRVPAGPAAHRRSRAGGIQAPKPGSLSTHHGRVASALSMDAFDQPVLRPPSYEPLP